MSPLYQELLDNDFEEAELERLIIQEGLTVEEIFIKAVDDGVIDPATGYCCCGSPVDSHGFGDGHSPVDDGHYRLQLMREMVS